MTLEDVIDKRPCVPDSHRGSSWLPSRSSRTRQPELLRAVRGPAGVGAPVSRDEDLRATDVCSEPPTGAPWTRRVRRGVP